MSDSAINIDWARYREEFPVTRNLNFQNHAGVAPLCARAVSAAKEYLDRAVAFGYVGGGFYEHAERVRSQAARLINAKSDEVTFVKNTSEGLSLVANGLNWKTGDNVVSCNAEFPSNVLCWRQLESRGVQMRVVVEENGRIPIDRVVDAIDSRTRVVAISSVQYASGFRMDLATLGEHCRNKGVFLCVDAIQSQGAFPIDVRAMHIDFLAADAHKWLCGPEGIGLFYVAREIQGHLRPTILGWMSRRNPFDFDSNDLALADNIRRYDGGSYNLAGVYGLGGALDLLLEIGVENICARLLFLTDRLVAGLTEKGYRVVSPRHRSEASGIVAFCSDLHDHAQIQRHLQSEHRLVIAVRKGRLRASPHFYNTTREIDHLIENLPAH